MVFGREMNACISEHFTLGKRAPVDVLACFTDGGD